MKDAILKIIKEADYKDGTEEDRSPAYWGGWSDACGYIEEKVEDYDPWISVEDRLPDDTGNYIVCRSETGVEDGYFTLSNGGRWLEPYGNTVTHWMPLPDAPQPPKAK